MEKIKNMKASVVVTTFNRSKILTERSLASALAQDFNDFEVIVLDDCSTDDTEMVVKKIVLTEPRLRFIRQDKNSGLAAARNRGAREARAEYVVFLDDDDALVPEFLKVSVPVLDALDKNYGGVTGGRTVIYDDNNKEYALPSLENVFYATIDDGWLLRKEVFDKLQYDEELLTDEDADFGIQFFRIFKGFAIDKSLLLKYSHPINFFDKTKHSFSFPSERRYVGLRRYLKKNLPIYEAEAGKKDREFLYRFAGRHFCWGGKMREGIPYLWKAWQINHAPRNFLNVFFALFGKHIYTFYFALETKAIRFIKIKIRKQTA